jgi:hypothetical protein
MYAVANMGHPVLVHERRLVCESEGESNGIPHLAKTSEMWGSRQSLDPTELGM